jgi:hypothetical protein
MNSNKKGYVTGIIDGEGYMGITNCGTQIRLVVTSTDKKLPNHLTKITGKGYSALCKRRADGRRIPAWQWLCFNGEAVELLQRIHPHLIVKQRQAKWILRFADYKANQQKLGNIDKQKIAQFGVQCGKKIRALNSRQRNKRLLKTLKLKNNHLPLASEFSPKYISAVPFEEIKRRLQRLRSFRNN